METGVAVVSTFRLAAVVTLSTVRIERDCKFISRRLFRRTRRGRTDGGRTRSCFYSSCIFSRRARLSPFVLKWTSCHYTPCYCYFFRRFYRVLRREGVPFGKMFVLRASGEFACRVMSTATDWKWVMEFCFSFLMFYFSSSSFCFDITIWKSHVVS